MSESEPIRHSTDPMRTAFAPAKLNLTLAIEGKRADGFHELTSWVAPISLADELRFSPSSRFEFAIVGNDVLPDDDTNLVARAVNAISAAAGVAPHLRIELVKRIPMGAGLGGGSSDAAACLLALNEICGLQWPLNRLAHIAESLGSDVPLFLHQRQLVMRGRGEQIEPLETELAGWTVLICPGIHLATADVYQAYAASANINKDTNKQNEPWHSENPTCESIMPQLFNELESAAFSLSPELRDLHSRLDGHCDRIVRMTGSGSALFSLFDTEREAINWSHQANAVAGEACVSVHRLLGRGESPSL